MISIPIHIKGKVSIKKGGNISLENLKNYLVDSLRQEEAKAVDIEQDQIRFDVGWCRPLWNWKILVPISTGIISLRAADDNIDVNYKLSFEKVIILSTLFVIIAFVIDFKNLCTSKANVLLILFAWIWLVGGNLLITALRFPRFLKRCASEVEKQVFYWNKK